MSIRGAAKILFSTALLITPSFLQAQSNEGNEWIQLFNGENLNISFNSKYLIDIASQIEAKNLMMNFKDSVSPVLIEDDSDKNSYYVIMPMKI